MRCMFCYILDIALFNPFIYISRFLILMQLLPLLLPSAEGNATVAKEEDRNAIKTNLDNQ